MTTEDNRNGNFPIVPANGNLKLFNGDFRLICRKEIPDSSVNLILTDPPYDGKYLYVYETLGTEGFRMLKDCGSLLTYASHNALPQIFDCMKMANSKLIEANCSGER